MLLFSSSNCRWNSMMVALRRMMKESSWSAVMTVLAQARIEASDAASAPPLVMVKREQVVDILSLLEPFEQALQVRVKFIEITIPGSSTIQVVMLHQTSCMVSVVH